MPLYTSVCDTCHIEQTIKLSFSEYDQVKSGDLSLHCRAETPCNDSSHLSLVFDPGSVNFVLRDGSSGGWTSKAGKENAYRAKRGVTMAQRERDHVFKNKLQPNYKGQETGSWKEAQAAASQDRFEKVKQTTDDTGLARNAAKEAAKTYDPFVKS